MFGRFGLPELIILLFLAPFLVLAFYVLRWLLRFLSK